MKINLQGAVPVDKLSTENKGHNRPETLAQNAKNNTKQNPNTQLSNMSKAAQQTFDSLSQQDDVDMAKVNQVKQAIANGELTLDQDVLINAMMDIHKP